MESFDEQLKDAIVTNDINFLDKNKNQYNINHRFADEDNDTLLSYAISDSKSDIYLYFLENGADILLLNNEGESIVHSIIYSGIKERLVKIVESDKFDFSYLNLQTNDGTSPLLLSVLLGKYDIFVYLLELNVDINLTDNEGNAPIHPACFLGHKNMVTELVNRGTNLHIKTHKGNYPLALAVNGDHDEIVKYLYKTIYA